MTKQEQIEEMASGMDTQKGAIMTSSIGDLPLTVEGLRKTVDEITRLNRVEAELQELNAKYYNEAKDLRRELKQARKETAKEILSDLLDLHNSVQDINQKTDFYCSIEQFIAEIEIKYDIEVKE